MYPKITLQKGKEQSPLRFHPWIFSGAIKTMDSGIEDGAIVEVYDSAQNYIATGHYQKGSIAIRILSFVQTAIDATFWQTQIQKAFDYRVFLGLANSTTTNTYRLIFGEGDGLPGLILDYYNGHIVFQSHSIGMYVNREDIKNALIHVYGDRLLSVYDKSAETLPKEYAKQVSNGPLYNSSSNTNVLENNHQFFIDWEKGQKTGFFIDQRESRLLLSNYCKDKVVLNTFSYTGGFSVYAAKIGQAKEVHSIDVSASAIELCNKNAELNGLTNHKGIAIDTFDFLKNNHEQYDVIILDPPAFAKSRDVKHNAVIGYKRLNAMALKTIKKGGVLFTFSCSQVIDKLLFYNTIAAAAIEARRDVKVLHYLSQPADHPIKPFFPEGEYLKGMVLYVD